MNNESSLWRDKMKAYQIKIAIKNHIHQFGEDVSYHRNRFITKDITRTIAEGDIQRLQKEGGVTSQEDSIWLLDFWSKKDIAGILLMPPTRHVMLHLNDCCKWKEHIRSHKKCFKEA